MALGAYRHDVRKAQRAGPSERYFTVGVWVLRTKQGNFISQACVNKGKRKLLKRCGRPAKGKSPTVAVQRALRQLAKGVP